MTLGADVKTRIDDFLSDPEVLYPGFLFAFDGKQDDVVCRLVGYDQNWLDHNQEIFVKNGNPLFYKIDKYTFIIQHKQDVEQLQGKLMLASKNGLMLLVLG